MEVNIYCDESCHLENDGINVMTIGGISCDKSEVKKISERIREIKIRNKVSPYLEVKWVKISQSGKQLYIDLINYFFDEDALNLRCILAYKTGLRHEEFNQSHDDWYYKIYYNMLKNIFDYKNSYNVYMDIKDSNSNRKIKKLQEILSNSTYDFDMKMIKRMQPIRSYESEIMQITDILIGAIAYRNRDFDDKHVKSEAKEEIVSLIQKRSEFTLAKTTFMREKKCNLFVWNMG